MKEAFRYRNSKLCASRPKPVRFLMQGQCFQVQGAMDTSFCACGFQKSGFHASQRLRIRVVAFWVRKVLCLIDVSQEDIVHQVLQALVDLRMTMSGSRRSCIHSRGLPRTKKTACMNLPGPRMCWTRLRYWHLDPDWRASRALKITPHVHALAQVCMSLQLCKYQGRLQTLKDVLGSRAVILQG